MNPTSYEARMDQVITALERLFGEREAALLERARMAARDLRDIRDQRGVRATLLTVLGHKNAGKSTLCRLLVDDPVVRERIGTGIGATGATRRILWIGPEAPARLEPEVETFLYCEAARMADLGSPYLLADIPGYSDGDAPSRAAAERILRLASTVAVVLSLEMAEDEAGLAYLSRCDGARLLPVVVDDPGPGRVRDARFEGQLAAVRERIAAACPASTVAEALVIPRFDLLSGEEGETARGTSREALAGALRGLFASAPPDASRLARTRFERFRAELRDALGEFITRVGPRYDDLMAREAQAAREVAASLQGSPERFAAGVRLRLLSEAAEACPRILFPYRSFLGLLTLCAGAWDRLVLSGLGSLPSLAMVVMQGGRNRRTLAESRSRARSQLAREAAVLAAGRIAPERRAFLRSIDDSLGRERPLPPAEPALEGLETLEADLAARVDAGVRRWRAAPGLIAGFGVVATALWLALAAGPLWAVYQEFFRAWEGTFALGAGWRTFPSPSAGMFFSTLLLIFAPVFGLAMVALAWVSGSRRVRRCLREIDADGLTQELLEKRVIHLRSGDEMEAAVRVLLDEGRVSDSARG